MAIELSKERREEVIESVQRYAGEKLERPLTSLEARLLIDFFVKELGAPIYNQAVRDVQAVLGERVAELDSVCFEVDEGYWEAEERRRGGRRA